jgi:hypothetical protein
MIVQLQGFRSNAGLLFRNELRTINAAQGSFIPRFF